MIETAQLARIQAMSAAFDRASEALRHTPAPYALPASVRDDIAALDRYQRSGQWLEDYEADEAGLLPEGTPRSVLSQDGLYNLLQEYSDMPDPWRVTLIEDRTEGGIRKTSFRTCESVCSEQIDIETEGDIIRRVQYTRGCHGNTQGLAALCAGMKVDDVIKRLEGIDCKGRGTSCPDQLARALRQL